MTRTLKVPTVRAAALPAGLFAQAGLAPSNLKVLPARTMRAELSEMMRGFTRALAGAVHARPRR